MHLRRHASRWFLLCSVSLVSACSRSCGEPKTSGSDVVVARSERGDVTAADVQAELNRLPPLLREKFSSEAGRRELASSIIDKRLLAHEAEKRGFDEDPEIQRQVRALQERLMIQALLAAEEKTAGEPSAEELQKFYDGHKQELASAELAHVARIFVAVSKDASEAERTKARARARALADRVKKGEPFEKVAAQGEGAERTRGGDMGFLARGKTADRKLEAAAFALAAPGDTSDAVETADGFAVLRLVAKQPARVPPLEEVRSEVLNRMAPGRQRRVFEDLLSRLRKDAEIEIAAVQTK